MSFQIPLHFEDLARSTAGSWQPNTSTLRHQPVDSLLELLEHDLQPVFHSPPSSQFNALYSLTTRYQTLSQKHRSALLSLIHTLPRLVTPTDPGHVKLALYFVAGLGAAASAVTCKAFDKSGREALLETALALIVNIPSPNPFPDNDCDQLASQMVRLVLNVLEAPSAARHKTARPVLARCLAAALSLDQRQILPASTALLHALNRHEHIPVPLAETLALLAKEGDIHKQFVSQLVREIATLSSEHLMHDTMAAKTISVFIADLSERLPDVFRSNLALVLSQLDADSYMFRNGIVHVIGALIRAEPNADDPLLDVLLERSHRDINAFTRSKGLQTWISLAKAKVVPNRLYPTLADMAASRLDDKAAAVRKYAAQLLGSLLENNPYGPALRVTHFQDKLKGLRGIDDVEDTDKRSDVEAYEARSEEVDTHAGSVGEAKSCDESDATEIGKENGSEDHSEKEQEENNAQNPNGATEHDGDETQQAEDVPSEEDREKALKVTYYSTAVSFITSVESGLETVYNMLRSKSVTDVSEGVYLLITAIQFQLEAASGRAVRKMLPLILARETNIRQAAVQAYTRLLAPGGIETVHDKDPAMAVANGLIALGVGATTGEVACLEALISAMCRSDTANVLSPAVVAVIWDLFAGRVPGASMEQRRAACMLIGMVASEKPDSLEQRLQTMETVGIQNPAFARWACVALCKLPQGSDLQNSLSQRVALLAKSSTDLPTVEQAVTAIFYVSSEPEEILGELIRDLAKALYGSPTSVQVPDLCRFLLVIGHVAVKELVRIESLVGKVRQGIAAQARDDGDNEEEEQAVAEAEKALELAEKELVSPKSILGRFGNLARKIAADQSAPAELQASAVLCMAKLMCVEESFCEKNLRLLFSILSSSPEPVVRSNSVTALGDLAFRFPNLVEPWSAHIYGALRDKDDKVRKNTLMALSHLILNDMIKVKGQIVGIAVCILDENERIADLARLFFNELARKSSNVIYNILPDTISCLSKMNDLSSESFKRVVSFLVGLMDREKHSDSMVEKLCHRFRTCEGERETRDLAFCISLLNMSERGIKKLADNFKSYSSVLNDDMVHSYITTVISKCTKPGMSPSGAQIVEELTRKIEAIRATAGDEETSSSVTRLTEGSESHSSRSRGTRATQKSSRSRGQRKGGEVVDEQVSNDDGSAESEEAVVDDTVADAEEAQTRTSRSRRPTRRKRIVEEQEVSDDDDEEEELADESESEEDEDVSADENDEFDE